MDINKLRQVLTTFEGNSNVGYVPMKGGKPLGNSGLTIGKGVDLGQQTPEGLAKMGVREETIAKLLPFFGLKGMDAVNQAQEIGEPELTDEEVNNLNSSVIDDYAKTFESMFKDKVGYDVSELNENQQLALTSLFFQFGPGIFRFKGKPTDLLGQLKDKDMEAVAGNIATFSRQFPTRLNATALLFQGAAGADQMEEAQRYVQDPAVRQVLAKGQLPEELTAPFVTAQPEGIIGTPFERKAPLNRQEPNKSDLQDWQEPGAFELPSATQPQYATMEELLKAKGEPEYATMEELMRDRGLMNPLLPNKEWIVG